MFNLYEFHDLGSILSFLLSFFLSLANGEVIMSAIMSVGYRKVIL